MDRMEITWNDGHFLVTKNSPPLPVSSGPFYMTVNGLQKPVVVKLELTDGYLHFQADSTEDVGFFNERQHLDSFGTNSTPLEAGGHRRTNSSSSSLSNLINVELTGVEEISSNHSNSHCTSSTAAELVAVPTGADSHFGDNNFSGIMMDVKSEHDYKELPSTSISGRDTMIGQFFCPTIVSVQGGPIVESVPATTSSTIIDSEASRSTHRQSGNTTVSHIVYDVEVPTIKIEGESRVEASPSSSTTSSYQGSSTSDKSWDPPTRGRKRKITVSGSERPIKKVCTTVSKVTTTNQGTDRSTTAISNHLTKILNQLGKGKYNKSISIAWDKLWKLTDERPDNCDRFMGLGGLTLFYQCRETFPNKNDLLEKSTGALSNVAEVKDLRSHLMTSKFIQTCCDLLDSKQTRIPVYSYNIASMLTQILSDGDDRWTIESPQRSQVMAILRQSVLGWDVGGLCEEVLFKSLDPILTLLKVEHTNVCQLWAAWTLAYLTKRNPKKYVEMLKKNENLSLMLSSYYEMFEDDDIFRLIRMTLEQM